MGLEKEIWKSDIIGGLYRKNRFLQYATSGDQYVLQGKVVHIPNANAASGNAKNRTSLPAAVTKRTDTDVTYALDEFTSNPVLIPNIDTIQLSYDKRASVTREDMAALIQIVANWMLRYWSPSTSQQIIRTTGDLATTTLDGATGQRRKLLKDDLLTARTILNKQDVPEEGRVALIPSDQMVSLLKDPDLLRRDFAGEVDIRNGVVSRIYGFELLERSATQPYDNALMPKDPGTGAAGTDCMSTLCWHPDMVERAMGTIDTFYRENDPTYYGNILSFLLMAGGRQRRADGKGVVAIVEATA